MLYAVFVLPIFNVYAEESMDKEGDNGVSEEENIEEDDSEEDDSLSLASNAKSAIIIEASTGKVIFEKNANEKLAMASMTKMMSLLLIMENIENGNLTWDEMITTSENAASMGGSQIFLQVGEQMSVEDMVKGICIASGNDVAVMKKQS
jgi:D-alanyl-D-alanine carboxypeptidase (penicillin-binding protein 5/6)